MQLHITFRPGALMPRASQPRTHETFNFRVVPKLKADRQTATVAQDKPAAQIRRDFMRAYLYVTNSCPE
jgi:hypothetical protein